MNVMADVPQLEVDLTNGLQVQYEATPEAVTRTVALGGQTVSRTPRALPADDGPLASGTTNAADAFASWWGAFIRNSRMVPDTDREPVRLMDLFSSVGGLSLGASEAINSLGMKAVPILAADVDERALAVYKKNLRPRHTVLDSVKNMVDFRVIGTGTSARFAYEPLLTDERFKALSGKIDMILAGPPCQGHSSLNNHTRHEDPKNLLYLTVPAAAVAMGVKHVVIENVPNVVADKHGVVATAMELFRKAGYNLTYGVLRADHLGWPQTRKRFFLIASLDTMPLPLQALAESLNRSPLPVSWILRDLESTALNDADPMTSVPVLSTDNRMRVDWLFDNDEHTLPDIIRPDCHQNGHTYPAMYGRMWADKPAPTITGGFLTPGRGRFLHPTQSRVLTPREAARVQGFPDWYEFSSNPVLPPSRAELARWIGNAVPSILGYVATLAAIGGQVKPDDAGLAG